MVKKATTNFFKLLIPTLIVSSMGTANADPCRLGIVDGFMGVSNTGSLSTMGLKAQVESFSGEGYLGALKKDPIRNVAVEFEVIFDGEAVSRKIGTATTNRDGWAQIDLLKNFSQVGDHFYFNTNDAENPFSYELTDSQFIQVVAKVPSSVSSCDDGKVLSDVYGTLYFRHPADTSPLLFTDIDDTLLNSADVSNLLRIVVSGHHIALDSATVDATWSFRNAGGTLIGVSAQFPGLRPFTKSELLRLDFDTPYVDAEYYYGDEGYDQSYRARSLPFIVDDEYAGDGTDVEYNNDVCSYKAQKYKDIANNILGGHWEYITGMIGDTEDTDGCSARKAGIHWYALMEGSDVVEDTSDPNSYTEIKGGWEVALPIVCQASNLSCSF